MTPQSPGTTPASPCRAPTWSGSCSSLLSPHFSPRKRFGSLRKGPLFQGPPLQSPTRGNGAGGFGLGCDGGAGLGPLGISCFRERQRVLKGRPASLGSGLPCSHTGAGGRGECQGSSGKLPETRSTNGCSDVTGKEAREGEDLTRPKAEPSPCLRNCCCGREFKPGPSRAGLGAAFSRPGCSLKAGKRGASPSPFLHPPTNTQGQAAC